MGTGTRATSHTAIDNHTTLYDSLLCQLNFVANHTVRVGAYIQIGVFPSFDGTTFCSTPIGIVQSNALDSITGTGANFIIPFVLTNLPPYFKIMIENRTGALFLPVSGSSSFSWVGVKN